MDRLHRETVSRDMWSLLQQLMADEMLKDFVLVGGTALSLKIGHRKSVDIDVFTEKNFDAPFMLKHLERHYDAQRGSYLKNSVFSFINKIKVDIVSHQYPFQKPIETIEGVRLASNEDIGAMKLHAIVQSGSRLKDFVDMFFLLEEQPLNIYMSTYENKYPNTNAYIAQLGLTYYQNIKFNTDIKLLKNRNVAWDEISERLKQAVITPHQKFVTKEKAEIDQKPKRNRGKGYRR